MNKLSSYLATAVFKKLSATLLLLTAMATPALGQTLQSIRIVPNAVTGYTGDTIAVEIIGTYSDGSQQDLTSSTSWVSSNTAVATAVTAQPQVTVVSAGGQLSTTLSATLNTSLAKGLTATLALTVLPGANPSDHVSAPTSYTLRGGSIGVAPFSTFSGGPIASVNLATDNILINIPVRTKSEQIPFSFSLVGNSSAEVPFQWSQWLVNTGIQGQIGGLLGENVSVSTSGGHTCYGDNNDVWITNFAIVDASGSTHPVSTAVLDSGVPYNGGWEHCQGTTMTGGVNDNSGMSMTYTTSGSPTWTIYDLHGNSVYPTSDTTGVLKDKNGNIMTVTQTTNGISVVDSEGVTVITTSLQGACSGCVDTYSYTDDTAATQKVTVAYGTYTFSTKFGCQSTDGIIDVTGPANQYFLPKTITIPKMTGDSAAGTYTLGYESTSGGTSGRLASITYPTGGKTTYTYAGGAGGGGINCTDELTVPSLTVKTTDTTSGVTGQWVYTNTAGIVSAQETVSVQDPMGNTETYTFNNAYLTELNQAGIIDNYVCYNGASGKNSCVTPLTELPTIIAESDVYSSMANGATNTYNRTETTFGQGQFVTSVSKWDLPGTGTAKTETEITPITVNGAVLPSVIKVIDPTQSNKQMALTNLFYNTAGDLNKKQRWTSGSNYLTTLYSPNSNGTPGTITDPNGAVTTMHYNGACGGLVPTSITNSFNSLISSLTMDPGCNQSVPVNQTPVSGFESSQTFADPLFRMDTATDEAGNTLSTNYRLNSVTTTQSFNGGTLEHVSTLDSLGRVANRQTYNGSSYDTVQTSYDAMGRVSFVSSPFSCSTVGGCSSPTGTTTTYDAASRVQTVTDANSGVTTYTYTAGANGSDVMSALTPVPSGDHGTQRARILQYDGLGRLTSVCEVNTFSDAAACGQTIARTGYITSYEYDALGNMIQVTQGVQTRKFTFDGLSRMLSEINPETGTTTYAYDYKTAQCGTNFLGDLVEIYHNNGGYVCFGYDGLHRKVLGAHGGTNASVTDDINFTWDSATVNGMAVGQKGKIAEAWTCPPQIGSGCTSHKTDEGFTYDKRGNPYEYFQMSPNSGGWYSVAETYDAIGNLSALSLPSVPELTVSGYDAEGRPTGMTAASGVSPVASAVNYGYFGALSVTYGSGDYDTFGYDNLGHMTGYKTWMSSSYYLGTLLWNANGTLGSLTTTDNIPGNGGGNCCGTVVNYHYDDVGRLWTAVGGALSQTFAYDRYGNLSTSGNPYSWNPPCGYNTAGNNYVQGGSCGISYDADGNILNDTFYTYSWNTDNKMVSANSNAITYDALDRVVETAVGEHLYAPGLGDIVQMNGQTIGIAVIPLPGSGSVLYNNTGVVGYSHFDWHGNSRLSTTQAGGLLQQSEYSPFGQQYDNTSTTYVKAIIFDSGDIQTLSNVFDMPNRNLHSIQGRWIQPDPAGLAAVDPSNPQSWNRYAYVLNNPLSFNDPTGLACVGGKDDDSGGQSCAEVAAADAEYQRQHQASATVTATPPSILSSLLSPTSSSPLRPILTIGAVGHHGMPGQWFRLLAKGPARTWFRRWTTGRLAGEHYYDAAHRAYNKAIKDVTDLEDPEVQEELVAKGVEKAREIGQDILDSDNPAISNFLDNMQTGSGTGREALQKALSGDGQAVGDFVSGAVGEAVGTAAEDVP